MNSMLKRSLIFTLAALLVAVPCMAAAAEKAPERDAGAMAADALIVRPLGLVGVVLGTAIFVVSLPFSAIGGNTSQAAEKLVAEPFAYTFKRPLGDL